jgi:hypothetical protein
MVSWLLPHSCNAAYLFSTLALSLLPLFTNKSAQGVSYGGLSSNVDESRSALGDDGNLCFPLAVEERKVRRPSLVPCVLENGGSKGQHDDHLEPLNMYMPLDKGRKLSVRR